MPSTALISKDSTRPLRRRYPWESWITTGTPETPVKLIIGEHVPKTHKLSSLVSQLHHYSKCRNTTLPPDSQLQLFTSRTNSTTLLVYSVPKSTAKPKSGSRRPNPALYKGNYVGSPNRAAKSVLAPRGKKEVSQESESSANCLSEREELPKPIRLKLPNNRVMRVSLSELVHAICLAVAAHKEIYGESNWWTHASAIEKVLRERLSL